MLVNYLREKGISDEHVLEAINNVPRHFFLDSSLDVIAYEDRALEILCNQTISQPSTVAFQTQLLNVQKGDKILEIGTGSGYQTCVLCEMKAKVFTIERFKPLFDYAKNMFEILKYKPKTSFGDGYLGMPAYAPFDKIIVTCGVPDIPQKLVEQMKTGGIMVIPVGKNEQKMYKVTKISNTEISIKTFGNFKFVPMLEERKFC